MSVQQRLFDGYSVSHERGAISSFQIEDSDIRHFQADDILVLVVTATVSGGSFKHDTSGDWVRTNKLVAHQVRVADGVMKDEIVEFYNLMGEQLPFTLPAASRSSSSGGSTHVDPSVASSGNTGGDDDDDDDQDFSYVDASQGAPADAPRDAALAAFLDEPA
jgi:hypothetical protein